MKRALILTIDLDLDELRALLDTLGISVVREIVQKMREPHRTSYLGPGKIEEIYKNTRDLEFDLIVINGILRPSQHHFLEMKFQVECIDRPGVILRIFANHAHSPEAIAQVTLAKLRYEQPFLREWIHKAKKGDRPGFLAGGAYATDVYFEHAKTHARRIEKNLQKLTESRASVRSKRRERGYSLVSLAGYTNAGKSALLNALCDSSVEVDDRLFSTLSTTTRRLGGQKTNILMTDTVGFMRNLPLDLVNAFNATLEEIFQADLVMLVFDASEKYDIIREKLKTSFDILLREVDPSSLILIGNKIDLLPNENEREMTSAIFSYLHGYELFLVSAKSGAGLVELRERITRVEGYSWAIDAVAPQSNEVYSLLSRLRTKARVSESSAGSSVLVRILCKPADRHTLEARLRSIGAKISSSVAISASGRSGNEYAPLEEKGPLSSEGDH